MGQTLSNGVYLPNEGERNCYAGLASNWQILNTAVGNIAEKAPLVHTHGNITNDGKVGTIANMPLITGTGGVVQAGAFGNQANTFCEGNDSRLSDARTPVAHTHTKSDVTDLLNSDFIPSANNSYDLGSSSYQWKTLNGINPGALSLPDTLGTSGTENVNYFNVIGYLNNTGTLATIPSTATYDGWLYINAKDGADSYIIIDDSPASFGTSVFGNNGLGAQGIGLLCLICPIRKGHAYNVRIKSAGIVSARIYPAQGNV